MFERIYIKAPNSTKITTLSLGDNAESSALCCYILHGYVSKYLEMRVREEWIKKGTQGPEVKLSTF
jgi:hypothetical protein